MIGYKKIPTGRMGNRLFHYNFLRQIVKYSGLDYFYPETPDSKYFDDMPKKMKLNFLFKKTVYLSSKDIMSYNPKQFLEYIADTVNEGNKIVLEPPILGEVFFDYLFSSPNEFIKIKKEFQKPFAFDPSGKTIVGLHFRGTDFEQWNHHASMKFVYYQKSVDYCLEYYGVDNVILALFTDDRTFPPYLETIQYLSSLGSVDYHLADPSGLPIYDFYNLSQSDVIISSPSTFAIFAGCLGENKKKIIHNQDWLDYAVGQGDIFWTKLIQSQDPIYRIWEIF